MPLKNAHLLIQVCLSLEELDLTSPGEPNVTRGPLWNLENGSILHQILTSINASTKCTSSDSGGYQLAGPWIITFAVTSRTAPTLHCESLVHVFSTIISTKKGPLYKNPNYLFGIGI